MTSEYLVLVCRGEVETQEGEAGHQDVTQGGGHQQQGGRAGAGLGWEVRLGPGEEEDNETE